MYYRDDSCCLLTPRALHTTVDVSDIPYDPYGNGYYYNEVKSTEAFMLGIAPIAGLQIHLVRRWSLNASILYTVYWRHPVSYTSGVQRIRP
jgi:hypothetical protein